MPVSFLSAAEREQFNSFPTRLTDDDIIAHFTLSRADLTQIPSTTTPANRLGFALQLSTLRFLGFYLPDLTDTSPEIVGFVSTQLNVPAEQIKLYSDRLATRTTHQRTIESYLDFRHPSNDDLQRISDWLLMRALEHDRPIILLQLLCEHFLAERFVRPGFSVVERMVGAARAAAEIEIHRRLLPILDEVRTQWLDSLLDTPQPNRPSQLARLRESARSNSPKTILATLDKLKQLQQWRVGEFDLSVINPNRRKQLAQIGYRANNQTLQRMPKRKRHPILLALLYQLHEEILDELVELFDRMLYKINRKTERRVSELKLEKAGLAGDKIKLLQNLLGVVFDPNVKDENLRSQIYGLFSEKQLRIAFDECRQISEPVDDDYFEQLGKRYSYLRQFIPTFLQALPINGNNETAGLREAVEILRGLDASGKRRIPDDAPRDLIPANWWNRVFEENDKINRRFYELAVLFELRGGLRSGDIWVDGSRRYNKIESYLIPTAEWNETRSAVCELLKLPEDGSLRLQQRQMELEALFEQFDCSFDPQQNNKRVNDKFGLEGNTKGFGRPGLVKKGDLLNRPAAINIRLENGELVFSKLPGEMRPDSSLALEELVSERLPEVELTDILIEVDAWTKFSEHFEHPSGNEPRSKDALLYGYASVLAQACNFGLAQMTRMSGFSYRQLAWHTKWYLREETLKAAFTTLVNFHNHLPLAKVWGGGTLSSSDGQRFPVAVKTRNAVALPKYFGYGKGLTYYTWTSDQYSQFGTKVIPSTVRDATYVLDEILDNETELTILEHTTDTAGYTDLVFGLFDLLGLQFSPRLADLADQKLFGIDPQIEYRHIQNLVAGKIKVDLILRHWDELVRLAGSLKLGFVTASLLISKLQSYPKQNALMRALQEYGKLQKTIFILKYLQSPEYQKKITVQLNKGEAMHALRTFLFVANERQIRKRNQEEQLNQAACLNLLANAVAVWNTVYLQAALDQLRVEGYEFSEDDARNLSPARSEHINVYGRYYFNVEEGLQRKGLRELRRPEKDGLR